MTCITVNCESHKRLRGKESNQAKEDKERVVSVNFLCNLDKLEGKQTYTDKNS